MTVARFLNLKQAISLTGANLSHANIDMKTFAQMFAQLFGEFDRARGNKVDVLAHSRFTDVCINGLGAEHNGIIAPAQKLEHRVMDCRQGQLFAHGKLLEGKASSVEHIFEIIRSSLLSSKILCFRSSGDNQLAAVPKQRNSLPIATALPKK